MAKTEPIVISPAVVDGLRMIFARLANDTSAFRRPADITESVDRDVITPRLLTAVQAGEFLGVDQTTVRELWRDGKLKCVHIGRGRKVSTVELWRYINEHEQFDRDH
ncbi:helix-turn-helix domain-containing protein [Rhodococcus erythropolis]|uniref:helix-turn-helix domain-containing protein n=1 Tax=Rhodococcus erythropolis TaxID=1833 RepID=UPI00382209BB|nr:helix-turn-helix domain-containing protein [Rhodococcus erythropolis]